MSVHAGRAADKPPFWMSDTGIDQNGVAGLVTGSPGDCFIRLETRRYEETISAIAT